MPWNKRQVWSKVSLACICRHFPGVLFTTRYSAISEKPMHFPCYGAIATKDEKLKDLQLQRFMSWKGALEIIYCSGFHSVFHRTCSFICHDSFTLQWHENSSNCLEKSRVYISIRHAWNQLLKWCVLKSPPPRSPYPCLLLHLPSVLELNSQSDSLP